MRTPAEADEIRIATGQPDKLYLELLGPGGAVMGRASMTKAVFARLIKAGADAWPQDGFCAVAVTFPLLERDREPVPGAREVVA